MNKSLCALGLCLFGVLGNANAQIRLFDDDMEYVSGQSVADIDMDGVQDTLMFDAQSKQLSGLLSSRGFDTFSLGTTPEDWILTHVEACDGGIISRENSMRYSLCYGWTFEKETGAFRLTEYSGDFLGNAANDGSGDFTLDLATGRFRASWYYFNPELFELLPVPNIDIEVECPPIYWGDDRSIVDEIVYSTSEKYVDAYKVKMAVQTDVVVYEASDGKYFGRDVRAGDSKYEAEKSRDSVICGKLYKKRINLYSDNILTFENYSEKYRVWQTPVLIVKDGATIYLEENEDRGVYYFGDFVPSNSCKFIYMSIYYTTLEFPGSDKEILKFSNGTIIDCQTGKELLSLFGTDVAGEWNNDDEWVSGDQILFSPLSIQK